ncbi:allophanate hydrolase [Microbacterium sp. Leaf320]|nr:allophanate hydrolase [Microbacterium sp. Leaf320]
MAGVSAESALPRPPRAPRTLVQKLAPIVLGFESIVVFLAGLTVFGLKTLPPGIPQWWGIVGGAIVGLACIAVAGMITKPWAITAGWVIQVIIALAAILVPAILLVVVIFGGMWGYATIMGARLDARRPDGPATETQTESE